MLKISFIIVALLLQNLSALSISKSEEFSTEHKAKYKQTRFEVNIEHNKQNIIEKKIKTISNKVKKSNICSGGKYTIYPIYRWEKNVKINNGYSSNISYSCEFLEKSEYESLLDQVKSVHGIKLIQHQIQYIQTKKERQQKIQQLEKQAFDYAKEYVKTLDDSFEGCKIESIEISSNKNDVVLREAFLRTNAKQEQISSNVSLPMDDSFKNSIKVDYRFSCN